MPMLSGTYIYTSTSHDDDDDDDDDACNVPLTATYLLTNKPTPCPNHYYKV